MMLGLLYTIPLPALFEGATLGCIVMSEPAQDTELSLLFKSGKLYWSPCLIYQHFRISRNQGG